MRSREEIQLDVDTSEDNALLRVVSEVLLDIRQLLIDIDDNVNRMDDRQR